MNHKVQQIKNIAGLIFILAAILLMITMSVISPRINKGSDDQVVHNMMGISMIIDVSTEDQHVHQVGNSWLRQMMPVFWCDTRHCTSSCYQVRDINNTLYSIICSGTGVDSGFYFYSGATGIYIGNGSTAVTFSDYKLESQIADGSGEGQLTHNAAVWGALATPTDSSYWQITRTYTNNSGSTVTVREVGIYMSAVRQGGGSFTFCAARDVLNEAVEVEALHVLTVVYTLQMTLE